MTHRVLIVEDTRAYQMIYEHWLTNWEGAKFEVVVANNTTEAEFHIKTWNPDCIVLDWILGREDGFVFLHHMREHRDCPPIVFITCAYSGSLRSNVLALGGADCFDKLKLDCEDFCTTVEALCRRTRAKAGCCDG